jgi:hypothetical protein
MYKTSKLQKILKNVTNKMLHYANFKFIHMKC